MSSPEFTEWLAWYRIYDAAKAGKLDEEDGDEGGYDDNAGHPA
jgi:hypothetical protein